MNNPADKMNYEINWIDTQIKRICQSLNIRFENIEAKKIELKFNNGG